MQIELIAAVADNGIIGNQGKLPWPHLREDMKHFRQTTQGHTVIMGRKTYESIAWAAPHDLTREFLPGRRSIILRRTKGRYDCYAAAGALAGSLSEAIDMAGRDGADKAFIIGGGIVYKEALPQAGKMHITWVQCGPEGDTHFPAVNWSEWRETASRTVQGDNVPTLRFATYERLNAPARTSAAKPE